MQISLVYISAMARGLAFGGEKAWPGACVWISAGKKHGRDRRRGKAWAHPAGRRGKSMARGLSTETAVFVFRRGLSLAFGGEKAWRRGKAWPRPVFGFRRGNRGQACSKKESGVAGKPARVPRPAPARPRLRQAQGRPPTLASAGHPPCLARSHTRRPPTLSSAISHPAPGPIFLWPAACALGGVFLFLWPSWGRLLVFRSGGGSWSSGLGSSAQAREGLCR
jgi:hypothetical protein